MKTKNIEIFEDTIKQLNENLSLQKSLENSKKKTKIYKESEEINISKEPCLKGNIKVLNKRSFSAAIGLKNSVVLNFASATNPGGGVVTGSSAQEECLCRISTLYPCLNQEFLKKDYYNYHRNLKNTIYTKRSIYTPNVTVFKTDSINPSILKETEWYNVNVITSPAPNLRNLKIKDKELLEIFKERIERILKIAIDNGNTNIVLGAWGCGAFKNPPFIVARAFKEVLENYRYYFDEIIFAIPILSKEDENYKTFERAFKQK